MLFSTIRICLRRSAVAGLVPATGLSAAGGGPKDADAAAILSAPSTGRNLDQCLRLACYWPQVNLKAAYQLVDQPLNFIFPSTNMPIPAQTTSIPGGWWLAPANCRTR
ncbi:MAG: hypothetical protein ABSH56_06280 [Bryobacteraceae bacterium]|jgi:hypothetical protein